MSAINKGHDAARLLADPLIKEVIESMKLAAFHGIEHSLCNEEQKRTDFYYLLRAINQFEQILTNFVYDGSIEQNNLKEQVIRTIIR